MTKAIPSLYSATAQESLRTFANHLLVIIAFFLPISHDAVKSGFFILILLFLLQKNPLELLKAALTNRVIQALIAVWLLHIIGIFYAENQHIAARYAGEMKFILYSIPIIILTQYRFTYRIFSAFILGVFLSEILSYGFFFELFTSPIPQALGGYVLASHNVPSPFTYHIEYGYILALTSALILLRLIIIHNGPERILLGIFLTTMSLNIFLNSARTGYILFFITNLTVLIGYYRTAFYKRLVYFIPFGLIILSIAWFSSSNIQQKYYQTVNSVTNIIQDGNLNSSIGYRVNMLLTGISAVKNDHLWLGYGTGMQGKAVYEEALRQHNDMMIQWLPDLFYTGYKSILDCSYTDVLVQFGLVGIAALLYLFIRIAQVSQPDPILSIIRYTLLFSAIFHAIVSSLFFGVLAPTIFVVLLSLTLVQPDRINPLLAAPTAKTSLLYIFFAVILFILAKLT
jgi:O-antigen ligase